MSMDSDAQLQTAREKVNQGIGRNLLLFQRAELMLKHLNARGALSSPWDELEDNFEKRRTEFNAKTLGQQLKHFIDNHCVEKDPLNDPCEDSAGSLITFGFSFTECEANAGAWKRSPVTSAQPDGAVLR